MFAKLRIATISVVTCVRPPSVRMEQLGFYWTDFHEILYLFMFRKTVDKIQDSLKSDNNNGYFTWRLTYRGAHKLLARPGKKQTRKLVRGHARFQQHRDASCHHVFFFTCKAKRRRKFTLFWHKYYLFPFPIGLGTYQHPCTFMIISRSVLLKMRNVSDKSRR